MTAIRRLGLLLLPLVLSQSGCVTAAMWKGYTGTVGSSHEVTHAGADRPQRVLRAARSGQGQHRVEVAYADGVKRTFTFWPQDLARVGGQLPALEESRESLPYTVPAGWVEVGVEDGQAWPEHRPSCGDEEIRVRAPREERKTRPALQPKPAPAAPEPPAEVYGPPQLFGPEEASEPPRVVFRLRGDVLEWREGYDDFQAAATVPSYDMTEHVSDGASAGDVALGALVVVATPATVALDVSLVGLLVALVII